MNKLLADPVYREELRTVWESFPAAESLAGRSILITGATGMIGSAVTDLLLYGGERLDPPPHIYAAARTREKLETRFGGESDRLSFVSYDANRPLCFQERVDYVIHAASNASPELYVSEPVETMLSNFSGMHALLEYARDARVKRVLYISSSEVYGQKQTMEPFEESDYGFVDILNTRSSYAVSKRAAETLCKAYLSEYGVDSAAVRPGHIYGPTATKNDNRISSVFMYRAARGEALVMKSEGKQLRSYCHCLDCASAVLTVLLKGRAGEAYNISNPDSVITIRQMAELLAAKGQVPLRFELPNDAERAAFNPMDNSSLDARKLEALGWRGCISAERGLGEAVEIVSTKAE